MACVSLPPKFSEHVVRRVVIVFEYRANYTNTRVNTEFRVKLFPRFLYRSRFTEHSPLLSHNTDNLHIKPCDAVDGSKWRRLVIGNRNDRSSDNDAKR